MAGPGTYLHALGGCWSPVYSGFGRLPSDEGGGGGIGGPPHDTAYSSGPHRFLHAYPFAGPHPLGPSSPQRVKSSAAHSQPPPASSRHSTSALPTMHARRAGPASSKLAALRHPGKTMAPASPEPPSGAPCAADGASGAPSLVWGAALVLPPHPATMSRAVTHAMAVVVRRTAQP
jgi:hypothetical protein